MSLQEASQIAGIISLFVSIGGVLIAIISNARSRKAHKEASEAKSMIADLLISGGGGGTRGGGGGGGGSLFGAAGRGGDGAPSS